MCAPPPPPGHRRRPPPPALSRNPLLHFSEALYTHITATLRLPLLLLLNKCDLVPPAAVVAWTSFFKARYPQLQVRGSPPSTTCLKCADH